MDEPFSVAARPDATGAEAAPFPPRLGRYRLLRRIATGGMAEIFLACFDESDAAGHTGSAPPPPPRQRICVIKRMLPALASQPDFVAMFIDEARLAAAMAHPNIVRTFDAGRAGPEGPGQDHYMALEYLHGEDLRTLFRALRAQNRRMPLDQVAHVVSCVCAGLQHAHDRLGSDGNPLHVVHRDVSPQNVVCTFDGEVKLLDFGIAKAQGRFGETRYGTLKGKIGYMSPEQCRGEPLDRRSDVFTVAILLYELSTGRRLFRGASEYEVLRRIVEEEVPSPRQIVLAHGGGPDYPEELDRIVRRGLARDPARRYPSAAALAEELDAFARREGLATSAADLSRFLEQVFVRKAEAWREAQRQGRDLAQHVIEQPAEAEPSAAPEGPELADGGAEGSAGREARHEVGGGSPSSLADGTSDADPEFVREGDGRSGVPVRVHDTPSARPRSASAPHRILGVPGEDSGPSRRTPGAGTRSSSNGGQRPAPASHSAADSASRAVPPSAPDSAPDSASQLAAGRRPLPVRLLAATLLFAAGLGAGVLLLRARTQPPSAAADEMATAGPASLVVVTEPAGAHVTLDGRPAVTGDEARFVGLAGGSTHLVVAEREGYHPSVQRVALPASGERRVTLTLAPLTSPTRPPTTGATP